MRKKKIDYRFKILYAAAILMVVAGHCEGGGISLNFADWFPYDGMHLALFTFCSGYFFKEAAVKRPGAYVWKKVRTLMFPMYAYTVVYGLIVQFLHGQGFQMGGDLTWYNILLAPLNNGHQFIYNMASWYVVPLFFVEILNCLIRAVCYRRRWQIPEAVFFAGAVLCGIAGNQIAIAGFRTGFWLTLDRTLYFVPFYALGIFYNRVLEVYADRIPSVPYFAVVFAIKLGILICLKKTIVYTPAWFNDFVDGPVMPVVIGFLGIALWMRIATILEPAFGRERWINLLADNTFSIMENQFLGFMAMKCIFGLISSSTKLFSQFSWAKCKSDIWWYYLPMGAGQAKILYLLSAILISLLIQYAINMVKKTGGKIISYAGRS